MKIFLKLACFMFLLVSLTACEERTVVTTTTTTTTEDTKPEPPLDEVSVPSTLVNTHNDAIRCSRYVVDGVEYLIFTQDHSYSAPFVINHTKDKLEIRLLKDNLKARNLDTE